MRLLKLPIFFCFFNYRKSKENLSNFFAFQTGCLLHRISLQFRFAVQKNYQEIKKHPHPSQEGMSFLKSMRIIY